MAGKERTTTACWGDLFALVGTALQACTPPIEIETPTTYYARRRNVLVVGLRCSVDPDFLREALSAQGWTRTSDLVETWIHASKLYQIDLTTKRSE